MITRLLAVAAFALAAAFPSFADDTTADGQSAATEIKAVAVWAEWCGACRALDPAVEAAMSTLSDAPVALVKLDYTDRDDAAFLTAADEAGVRAAIDAYIAHEGSVKTGKLLLVDASNGALLGAVTRDFTEDQIRGAILAGLGGAAIG